MIFMHDNDDIRRAVNLKAMHHCCVSWKQEQTLRSSDIEIILGNPEDFCQ